MRIGLDLWPFGRVVRVVSGLLAVAAGVSALASHDGNLGADIALTAVYVAGLTAFYLLLHRFLGERVLARTDRFLVPVIVIGPLVLLGVLPYPMHAAIGFYLGASLILTAAIGYGGCELLSLPTLLFGRRYVAYCPFNIVDAAERPLRRSDDRILRAAAVFALVVAGYFLVLDPFLDEAFDNVIPGWWAMLLLVPAAAVAERAWRSREDRARAFQLGLGAAALVAGAIILSGLVDSLVVFGAVVLAGLLLTAIRLTMLRLAARNRPQPPATPAAEAG